MNGWIYLWLGVIVFTGILEVATLGLTCIWFTAGGLIALIAAFLGAPIWLQALLFVLSSGVLLAFTRPIVVKYLKVGSNKTNVDAIPGKIGLVTETIRPIEGEGQVKLEGQIWSAKPEDETTVIEAGTTVTVLSIEGVKLIVRPISTTA